MSRISEFATGFLLNAAWQITILVLVAWVCSRILRSAAPRYRHALWVAALVLSVALPLWSVLDVRGGTPRQTTTRLNNTTATAQEFSIADSTAATRREIDARESGPTLAQLLQQRRQPIAATQSLSLMLALGVLLSVLYRLCWLWLSWLRTRGIRRSVSEREIPAAMRAVAARCRQALRLQSVPLMCSARVRAPVTIGARRPLIILPESFYADLPQETLASVLGHEMAHIARRDYALNLVYELLLVPVSFHPLAHYVKRQIDRTRELACDDMVTRRVLDADAYARSLVRVASTLISPAGQTFTLGVFDADILEERIMKLTRNTRRLGRRAARLLTLAAFSLLCLSSLTISTFSFDLRMNGPAFQEGAKAAAQQKEQSLSSANAQERAQAACDAGRKRAVEAIPQLVSMLNDDAAIQPLKCWDTGRWSPALDTFKQPSPGEQAAIALASMGTPALEPLTKALGDSQASVRRNAAWAIGELTNMRAGERAEAVPSLISLMSDSDEWVRMAAVRALGEIRDERAVEGLLELSGDGGWKVRELTAWALGEMKERRAVRRLSEVLLEDTQAEVRETAAWALGEIRDPQAASALNKALNDSEQRVRSKAKWALSEINNSDSPESDDEDSDR